MQYLSTPILSTPATVLLVPCSLSGKILEGLQTEVARRYGESYEAELVDDIRNDLIRAGVPGLYQNSAFPNDPMVLHIPVVDANGKDVLLTDILAALREVAKFAVDLPSRCTMAVGPMAGAYPWETWEDLYERMEVLFARKGLEFWMYPAEEDVEVEKEEEGQLVTL